MYPLHRYTQYIIFSDRHNIQIYKFVYSPHRNTHILFSNKHIISTSQIDTLNRNAHYILFQENILYPLHRNTHYFLFTEIHTISPSQKNTLYPLKRNTHYSLFSQIHIISPSQKRQL